MKKKTDSRKKEEVKVYLPSGPIPVRALTNKQLINVARYNNPTEEEKINRKQNANKVISSFVRPLSISGAIIGGSSRLHKGSRAALKGAALGTAIGTGIGLASGITLTRLGHKHHKKAAEVAEDELKTRNNLGIVYAKPGEWPELDRFNAEEYQNEKVFSVTVTEEELKLFSEFIQEQKGYARRDDLEGYTDEQQAEIIGARRRLTLDEMDAKAKAYDREVNDWKDLHKLRARRGAAAGAVGIGLGAGISKKSTKAGIVGATVGAGVGALAKYAGSKEDQRFTNKLRKADPEADQELQEIADIYKVLNGRMTKKQFIKKHNKKNKED